MFDLGENLEGQAKPYVAHANRPCEVNSLTESSKFAGSTDND